MFENWDIGLVGVGQLRCRTSECQTTVMSDRELIDNPKLLLGISKMKESLKKKPENVLNV